MERCKHDVHGNDCFECNPPAPASERDESALERSVRYWMSKVYCPYKAPELRAELALEAFDEFRAILNPPKGGAE